MQLTGGLRINMGNNEKIRMQSKNGMELVFDAKNFALIRLPKCTNNGHRELSLDLPGAEKYKKKRS